MSEVTIPDVPISRVEQYLNNIATGSGTIPPYPISRKEQYLAYIAEHGGGSAEWGGITGDIEDQTDLVELLAEKANKSVIKTLSLPTASWVGNASPYTQTVTITGYTVTANTKVDVQTDGTAIGQMVTDGTTAIYIDNTNGTLTAYAIGEKPTAYLSVQATLAEVTV